MTSVTFRAGITITSGKGWFRPILSRSSWPLQKVTLTETGLEIGSSFLERLIGVSDRTILWTWIDSIGPTWFGMNVHYSEFNESFEMEITSPGCYDTVTEFLRELADELGLLS